VESKENDFSEEFKKSIKYNLLGKEIESLHCE
jgi:hypothetical protein